MSADSGPILCLASRSPRRAELLRQIGVAFRVMPADIDESARAGEMPRDYVCRIALEKAREAYRQCAQPGAVILASDTTVVAGGEILGKPRDRADGLRMLRLLSGTTHQVLTAVALLADGDEQVRLSESRVRFRALDEDEMARYWETGEPADKAGGYAIQGAAALFIAELAGSYSGVMGLPLFETGALLQAAGIAVWSASPS